MLFQKNIVKKYIGLIDEKGDHRDGSFDQLSYKPYVLRAS